MENNQISIFGGTTHQKIKTDVFNFRHDKLSYILIHMNRPRVLGSKMEMSRSAQLTNWHVDHNVTITCNSFPAAQTKLQHKAHTDRKSSKVSLLPFTACHEL
jgi:hypothetical protein